MSHTVPLAIEARVALINGNFELAEPQTRFMGIVRQALSNAANEIKSNLPVDDQGQGQYDVGRIVAGLDSLQASKDILCAAAILPAYKPASMQ